MKHLFLLAAIAIGLCFCGSFYKVFALPTVDESSNLALSNMNGDSSKRAQTNWTPQNYKKLLDRKKELLEYGDFMVIDLCKELDDIGMSYDYILLRGTSPWDRRNHGRMFILNIVFYETYPDSVCNNDTIRTMEVSIKEKVDLVEFCKKYPDDIEPGILEFTVTDYKFANRVKDWRY